MPLPEGCRPQAVQVGSVLSPVLVRWPYLNLGYTESETGTGIYYDLAAAGFAVIAFDAIGFGTRG
jgi:hypothetical protein